MILQKNSWVRETRGKVDISVSSDNGPANSCTEIQYAQSGKIAGSFNIEMVAFLSLGIKIPKRLSNHCKISRTTMSSFETIFNRRKIRKVVKENVRI